MKKNYPGRTLYPLSVMIMVVFSLISCGKSDPAGNAPDPVTVTATTVTRERLMYYDIYPGTVVALSEVELRSEVPGFITGIFFREGEFVKKGTKLYEIDRSRYLASFQQANANVEIAGSNVERAKRYVDRYSKLMEQEAIARQRFDDAQTDLQNANLELESAKAGLVKARTDLDRSLITAPFDGTIGLSHVKMGALVSPGQTLLNTISTDDPMGVDIVINEKELQHFRNLNGRKTAGTDSTFRITLPDNSIYSENGKIRVIDRAIDPQTGTIRIRLEFSNSDGKLTAGMSCKVNILHTGTDEELVIPSRSLMEQMSEYFVFVVDSQKAFQTKVTLGALLEGKAVITEGLKEGQLVVTDGLQKLQNGTLVAIENKTDPITN